MLQNLQKKQEEEVLNEEPDIEDTDIEESDIEDNMESLGEPLPDVSIKPIQPKKQNISTPKKKKFLKRSFFRII